MKRPRRTLLPASLTLALCGWAARAESPEERGAAAKEHGEAAPGDDELIYAMGAILGTRAASYGFSDKELQRLQRGFADAAAGRKLKLDDPDLEEWGPRVDGMLQRRGNPLLAREKERGRKVAEAEARESGARRLPGEVVFRVLRAGDGPSPKPTDRVRVRYEGRTADGKVFDANENADVPVDKVVRCWTVALPNMKVGGKARLVCPSALAYGDQGRPPQVPGGATVLFDIELLSIAK